MKIIENKFIKQNNEQIRKENFLKLYKKVRKEWLRSPVTKIKQSKKRYNRQLTKKEIRNILKQEDL